MSGELRSLRCPCGFEVRSTRGDEIIRTAKLHAKEIRGQDLTDEQARALILLVV